jgi:GNAT superfamily N-acetyltransferase
VEASRLATDADIPRVVELARAMHAELAALKGGELWNAREARPEPLEEAYRSVLASADARLVVGTIDGAVIGFGVVVVETLRTGRRLGVVTDLFVEEEGRAVGVGEALIGALLRFCTESGCDGVDAWALPGHRDTKNFFEESGFSARGIVMHRRGPPAGEPR